MIQVTKLNGQQFYLNPHQIESIELTPDTTITMLSGKRLVVKDRYEVILREIIDYRKQIGAFKNEE
ncbi:MAG: flagellar FlbD family protein [Spirochaetia bacterium]|nr:flagellar FlbD family protein [Spirochaetia bacterium]